MRYDSGDTAEDDEEGYEIKVGHIEDALQKIGLAGVGAVAYNARADDPETLTGFVLERIGAVRRRQAGAAKATIAAIDEMIENRAEATAFPPAADRCAFT